MPLLACGAEPADRARDEWQIVRHCCLAKQRLRHARTEPLGHRDQLVGGVERASAGDDRDFAARVEDVAVRPSLLLSRSMRRGMKPGAEC